MDRYLGSFNCNTNLDIGIENINNKQKLHVQYISPSFIPSHMLMLDLFFSKDYWITIFPKQKAKITDYNGLLRISLNAETKRKNLGFCR